MPLQETPSTPTYSPESSDSTKASRLAELAEVVMREMTNEQEVPFMIRAALPTFQGLALSRLESLTEEQADAFCMNVRKWLAYVETGVME